MAGKFQADEPEWEILEKYVSKGDWVIDIGANIGTYTVKLSKNCLDQNQKSNCYRTCTRKFLSVNHKYFSM